MSVGGRHRDAVDTIKNKSGKTLTYVEMYQEQLAQNSSDLGLFWAKLSDFRKDFRWEKSHTAFLNISKQSRQNYFGQNFWAKLPGISILLFPMHCFEG